MAALLDVPHLHVHVLVPMLNSSEIAHMSGTINDVPRPALRDPQKSWKQKTEVLFVICVHVCHNFTTLNDTCFILLHEYINPMI